MHARHSTENELETQGANGSAPRESNGSLFHLDTELLLRGLIESTSDSIFLKDLEGRYKLANGACARLLGCTPAQIIGRRDTDLSLPELSDVSVDTDRRVSLNGETLTYENTLLVEGAPRIFLVTKSPYRDHSGKVAGIVAIARDVTDLRDATENMKRVAESARCILWEADVKDCNGELIWEGSVTNEEAASKLLPLELKPGDDYNTAFWDYAKHPDDEQRLDSMAANALRLGATRYSQEYRCRCADGSTRWLFEDVHIEDRAPGRWRAVGVCTDITEAKDVEESRERWNKHLAALNAITSAVSASLDLERVLGTLVDSLETNLSIPAGVILLFDAVHDVLMPHASWGLTPEDNERITKAQTGCLVEIQSRRLKPAGMQFHELSEALSACLTEGGASWPATLSVPLIVEHRIEGLIDLFSDKPSAFGLTESGFFRALSGEVAVAVRNARLYSQILGARNQLENLSQRLVDIHEAERKQVAHDLHDEIAQTLTGLKMQLDAVVVALPEEIGTRLKPSVSILRDLMQQVREMSLSLRPNMLDDCGLISTLIWHLERFEQESGIQVEFRYAGFEDRLPTSIELAAYRIIQEALLNVARHSGATSALLDVSRDNRKCRIAVVDYGEGFESEAVQPSGSAAGLAAMKERARLLGGMLTVTSAPGHGTRIVAELPLDGSQPL